MLCEICHEIRAIRDRSVRTNNVTLKHGHVTIVAVEKQNVINYECVGYPACKSHLFDAAFYCLWSVWLCHTFPRYLIQREGSSREKNCRT